MQAALSQSLPSIELIQSGRAPFRVTGPGYAYCMCMVNRPVRFTMCIRGAGICRRHVPPSAMCTHGEPVGPVDG